MLETVFEYFGYLFADQLLGFFERGLFCALFPKVVPKGAPKEHFGGYFGAIGWSR